ncbi:MAG: SDR family oxidoreductase [Gemmatimonadales bacterium]|nr:SDR family oxidoreductase [Gemmatimonadales bacterium]
MVSLPAVLITGASTGIGECCARRLALEGYYVYAGVRNPADGERLRAHAPDRIRWILLDVTNADHIARVVEELALALGGRGLAGLVNNAGLAQGGPLEYVSAGALREQFEVNVIGLHAVTVALLPLVRQARGRIVHIGSISGRITSPFTGPYAASKHAVEALADALRLELAPEGIHVSLIEPGQIRTRIWEKGLAAYASIGDRIPAEGLVRYGGRLTVLRWVLERALRHSAPPEAVADAVMHALTAAVPRSRYLVGADARLRLLLGRLLPDRAMDGLVLWALARIERRLA